ncbi:MAG: hypothetical protein BJ554DRAFT_6062, partial [Olpidium bornovanus]
GKNSVVALGQTQGELCIENGVEAKRRGATSLLNDEELQGVLASADRRGMGDGFFAEAGATRARMPEHAPRINTVVISGTGGDHPQ